ncbi:MAG: DUF4421 family protein [Bacteroidaceae bacterium]|nr:DUF4421 family protein [Bacteroidaceae bacterium]
MRYNICVLLVLLFHLFAVSPVRAQNRLKKAWTKVDGFLEERYYRTSSDTNYVVRPDCRWTLKLRGNQTGNSLHAKGTVEGTYSRADLSASHKTTISIGVAYRGISLAYSINPAKLKGIYDDYELNFNYYGSRLSLDASYQRSTSMSGDIKYGDELSRMEKGDVTMKVYNLAGYYCFNHKKFSFPAAFSQSYIQRRSAGSWLAGLSYQGGHIDTNKELKERVPDSYDVHIKFGHLGIGGGYGYNLVLWKKWLFHLSLLPTFVVYNYNRMTVNEESINASRIRFNMLFNERAAIVCNITPRYFAGTTLVMTNSLFDDKSVVINQNKWIARVFVGMRL